MSRFLQASFPVNYLKKAPVFPILILLIVPFLLFWQVWWPGEANMSFANGDFLEQYYPMRAFVAGEIRQGRLPLWDAFTYGGEPSAGSSLSAPFYPLGLWHAVFPGILPVKALELDAILHLGMAGVFTYLFVRRLTQSDGAGIVAGFSFSLGGFLTSYPMLQLGILHAAVWLPLILLFFEIGIARRSLWWIALGGAIWGVSFLAGHPQTSLYISYTSVFYLFVRTIIKHGSLSFTIAALFLAELCAVGIGAPAWLPVYELMKFTSRASLTYHEASQGFDIPELWGIFRPNSGEWSPLYIGLIPLILAIGALMSFKRQSAILWAFIGLIMLMISLGEHGVIYRFFYEYVPGFAIFRQQERAAFIFSFSLSIMAGYGYVGLLKRTWWRGRFLVLLAALIFTDLFIANNAVILEASSSERHFTQNTIIQHLKNVSQPDWRISSEGLLPGKGNAGLVYQLRDITGSTPLHLVHYDQFLEQVPEIRWIQLLNVQHLITQREIDHGAAQFILEEHGSRLYQLYFGAVPLWIAREYRIAKNQEEAIALTADINLNPFSTVILERSPQSFPASMNTYLLESESIQLVEFRPNHISITANLQQPGILVLSEIDYPGWIVTLNGKKTNHLRAYGLLRAISLPAGMWQIEWKFRPISVYIGISMCFLIVLGLIVSFKWQNVYSQ